MSKARKGAAASGVQRPRESSMEDKFVKIAEEAIATADGVECSLTEYRDGLKAMMLTIQDRYINVCAECGDG